MNQGLLNWLNAVNHVNHNEKVSEQIKSGLLLAPIDDILQVNHEPLSMIHEINEPVNNEINELEIDSHDIEIQIQEPEPEPEPEYEPEHEPEEHEQPEYESEHETGHEPENASQELNTLIGIPVDVVKNSAIKEAQAITQELQTLKNEVDSIRETTRGLDLNKAWHEANAGIELSMNEPPPQIWSSSDEAESESEAESEDGNENDSDDYEHIILQQDQSSITIHGMNFTQRLQRTLQGRRKKNAELKRKSTAKHKHSRSYILNAIIMCGFMLFALGLAWLSLRYIQTKTPDSFNQRASELYEHGKYDEAMNLYQEGYNRYPNDIRFIEGIAKSAEKAGHSQTANIAWNEYNNAEKNTETPNEPVEFPQPLEIKINTGGDKNEEPKRILTFDEYLNEANRLYNIRMYTRSLVNFMKALELSEDDIRPYIGLSECYKAKGFYFEAGRILHEAERKFGRNPTIEILKKLLKGSN